MAAAVQSELNILAPDQATCLLPFRQAGAGFDPLRVTVVLESPGTQRWIQAAVEFLSGLAGLRLCVLSHDNPAKDKPAQPGWLMDRLYAASRQKFDPYSPSEWSVDAAPAADRITPASIAAHRCDVLLWLAPAPSGLNLQGAARLGVLTVHLGQHSEDAIPFWSEVAASQTTTEVRILWHDTGLESGRVVRTAELSTIPGLYFTQNGEEPLIAAIRMLASLCLELRQNGPGCVEHFRTLPEEPVSLVPPRYPSTLAAGGFIARKLARSAYLRLSSRVSRQPEAKWFVALRPNRGESIAVPNGKALSGFKPIPLPDGSEAMADPFLWELGEQTWLLFEEMPPNGLPGKLACMELRQDGSCGPRELILDCAYHMSYPCVIPDKGDLFLLPESSAARRVELYRFSRFPGRVERVAVLVEDFAAVDTTPIFLDGLWYFFTTTRQPFLETLLFWSDRLDGRWRLHPSSPISGSVKNSRSAGNLFWKDGRLFRPTQDCSVRYGYAIRVNEVVRLTPTVFEERMVHWVPPSWMPGLVGTHTWNESSRWQVMDGLGQAPPSCRSLVLQQY
jgi:hypothetical protein